MVQMLGWSSAEAAWASVAWLSHGGREEQLADSLAWLLGGGCTVSDPVPHNRSYRTLASADDQILYRTRFFGHTFTLRGMT